MPDAATLKPCPFCGKPAKAPIRYNGTMETGCEDFECAGSDVLAPIAAWNRRAPDQQKDATVERLRAALEELSAAVTALAPHFDEPAVDHIEKWQRLDLAQKAARVALDPDNVSQEIKGVGR